MTGTEKYEFILLYVERLDLGISEHIDDSEYRIFS